MMVKGIEILSAFFLGCGLLGSETRGAEAGAPAPPQVTIQLSIPQAIITEGHGFSLKATVSGSADTAVQWSVQEPGGGTVDAQGSYTAPARPGTFHLVATSHANPAIRATATFSVVPAPVITSFASSQTEVLKGQSVHLTARFAGGEARVDHDLGAVTSGVPFLTAPETSTVYVLTVTNAAGTSVSTGLEVTVDSSVAVAAVPANATVHPGQTQAFRALVTGTLNQAVTWQLREPAGGSITAAGLYRAPAAAGTYHVLATSVMDPARTAEVTVVVPLAWGTPAPIEPETPGSANNAFYPRIAVAGDGSAVAVWQQSDGTRCGIWANRYAPGSGWGTATLIEPAGAGDSEFPQVACAPGGEVIAVWQQTDGTQYNIWANRYDPGSGWGEEARVETAGAGNAGFPQIAFDGNGDALAIWEQDDGTHFSIWSSRYAARQGWGLPSQIDAAHAGNAVTPQVAFDGKGNALTVWSQSNGTQFNIWANGYR